MIYFLADQTESHNESVTYLRSEEQSKYLNIIDSIPCERKFNWLNKRRIDQNQ